MASTKFPRKEFEKELSKFGIKLTKEVEDKISMMGTHLENINDNEVELEILPNRPDLFSMQGFVRSFSSFAGKNNQKAKTKEKYKINPSNFKIIVDKSVEKLRPFSMAAVVKNIKFTDEKIKDIMQWQEKIHSTLGRNRKKIAIGYYIFDKIKWPVIYRAEDPKTIIFEPLDTNEKMNALQILQRHPTGRDYAKLLEGFEKFPVYRDANNEVLSIPPIINSNSLGKILPETRNILVECTGTNLDLLKKVISMAVMDLIDCGGEAYSVEVIYNYNNFSKKESIDLKPEKIKLNINNANRMLGLSLKEAEVQKLLEKMRYEYNKGIVLIPPYRTDIMHEVDIIEDIAIAYGYENFIPEIPQISTIGEISKLEELKNKISNILSGLNMLELSSYHILTKEDIKKFYGKLNPTEDNLIEVEDSKTDYKILKPNLIISTIKTLGENIEAEYPQRIFEVGRAFEKENLSKHEKEETRITEKEKLCIAISSKDTNFTEIKQTLGYLMKMLGLTEKESAENKEVKENLRIENAKSDYFIDGRCGDIILNNKSIGIIGEISPKLLESFKIKMPVSLLEIDVEELI